MYADDSALLANSHRIMQQMVLDIEKYCDVNTLSVNINKTKFVVFSSSKAKRSKLPLIYNIFQLEEVYFFISGSRTRQKIQS